MKRQLPKTLKEVVQSLRGPEGCPWDKEQTHSSLTRYAIEEAYELQDAILSPASEAERDRALLEELGDLLLQVVLHGQIAEERGAFTLDEIERHVVDKMIRRHPHVFGDTKATTAAAVTKNWEAIKEMEKPSPTGAASFQLPRHLPSAMAAQKIGEKTSRADFDWETASEVLNQFHAELKELQDAIKSGHTSDISHEMGDVLFTAVQVARHLNLDAELTLHQANQRFESRYFAMQKLAQNAGLDWSKLSRAEKEKLWQKVKIDTNL